MKVCDEIQHHKNSPNIYHCDVTLKHIKYCRTYLCGLTSVASLTGVVLVSQRGGEFLITSVRITRVSKGFWNVRKTVVRLKA